MIVKNYMIWSQPRRAFNVQQEDLQNPGERIPPWLSSHTRFEVRHKKTGMEFVLDMKYRGHVTVCPGQYIVKTGKKKLDLFDENHFDENFYIVNYDSSNLNDLVVKRRSSVLQAFQVTEEFFEGNGELPAPMKTKGNNIYLQKQNKVGVLVNSPCNRGCINDVVNCNESFSCFEVGDFLFQERDPTLRSKDLEVAQEETFLRVHEEYTI